MTEPRGGSDAGMGDDVYQPQPDEREVREDTGLLDTEDTLDDRGLDQALDEGYSPPERPYAVEDTGTTAREQRTGESLERRLARERPEEDVPPGDGLGDTSDTDGELIDPQAGDARSGRLVGPDEGAHPRRDGVTGADVGIDGGAASAEEAAVHVMREEPAERQAPRAAGTRGTPGTPGTPQGSEALGEEAGAMSQDSEPDTEATTDTAGPTPAPQTAAAPQERTGGLHFFHRRERKAAGTAARGDRRDRPPEGLAASLVTSGGMLLAMVEDIRMREANQPEDLRLLADTFARHNAAKEATVLKVLERKHVAERIVERDRQEGTLLQDILDRALMGRHPWDTHTLTVDGALAQMYQYLFHERRDLVPAIQRAVTDEDSTTLATAFEAIDHG